ncbi:titin-like isoform X2 [Coccinella septempunctata]|uniref:titin-like isoform X2 n=1 Tax=Coccinella septempunctata TaxID=41139 RepID=UPI001D07F393|nr:titin-like isoform X2 [Coccinella septempunctata]
MQNAGLQYGEGVTPVQESPFVTAPVNSTSNSTSSLRQFRKKENVDKAAGAGGGLSAVNQDSTNSSHVARVAPHNHYPHKQNEYFRYPPQYQEYSSQYKEPTVKYSEIADPVIQPIPHLDHLPPSVLSKHKEKEYVDMCNIPQQSHINKAYPEHQFNGQQGYPPDMSMHHQYMHKEPQGSQMHSPYKPESQYIPKEGAFNHQIPPFLKYNIPQSRNYGPLDNASLTPFQRMDPHLARSFMTEHHHIREFPTEYSPMEQSRMYAQKQRYYPTPLPPSNTTYPPNYPHRNMTAQQYNYPSCNYPRSAQMNTSMGRYAMNMERSMSPRRTYAENMEIGMGFPPVPQKIQTGYPNYPAYAQHYQQRRPPAVPQDYYHHPQQHPHPRAHAQYMPNHHAQEMTENHVASNNIRQYLENWAEEEPTAEIPTTIENPKYISRLNRDETNEVYVINASELPQYLENGVPLIASENGQYIFKSNVSIDNTGAIKILDKTSGETGVLPADSQDRVVSLHIIENPKGDCLVNRPTTQEHQTAATINVIANHQSMDGNAQRPYHQPGYNRMNAPHQVSPIVQNGDASLNLSLHHSDSPRTPDKPTETYHEVPQQNSCIVIPSAQSRLNFDESLLPNPSSVPCEAKQKKDEGANAMISNVMNEEAILKEAHEELDKIVQDTLTSANMHMPMENHQVMKMDDGLNSRIPDYLNLDLDTSNPKDLRTGSPGVEENEAIIDLSTTSRRTSKSENEEQEISEKKEEKPVETHEELKKNDHLQDEATTIKHMPLIFDGFEEHTYQKSEKDNQDTENTVETSQEKKEETKEDDKGEITHVAENSEAPPVSPETPTEVSVLKTEEMGPANESKPETENEAVLPPEESVKREETTEVSVTTEEITEISATMEETTEISKTTEEPTEFPVTTEETTEVPLTKEETTEDLVTEEKTIEVSVTREETTEVSVTGEETTEVSLTKKETTEVLVTKEETTEVSVTREETTEVSVTGEETTEVSVTGEETTEVSVTKEETTEIPESDEDKTKSKLEYSEDKFIEIPRTGIKRKRIFSVDDIIYRIGSNSNQTLNNCEEIEKVSSENEADTAPQINTAPSQDNKETETQINTNPGQDSEEIESATQINTPPSQDNEETDETVKKNDLTEETKSYTENEENSIECSSEDKEVHCPDVESELSNLETKQNEENQDEETSEDKSQEVIGQISESTSFNGSECYINCKSGSEEEIDTNPQIDEERENTDISPMKDSAEVEVPSGEEVEEKRAFSNDASEENSENTTQEDENMEKSETTYLEVKISDETVENKGTSTVEELSEGGDNLKKTQNSSTKEETKQNSEIPLPVVPEGKEDLEKDKIEEIDETPMEKEENEVSEDLHLPEEAENLKRCLPETFSCKKEEAKTENGNKRMKLDTEDEEAIQENEDNKMDFVEEASQRPCRFSVIQRTEPSQREATVEVDAPKNETPSTKTVEEIEKNTPMKKEDLVEDHKKHTKEEITFEQRFVEPLLKKEVKDEQDEEKSQLEDFQYRSVLKIEENVVLLEICGELVEISVNQINGKKVITVVPISSSATVDINDNYEHLDRVSEHGVLETTQNELETLEMYQETCVGKTEENEDKSPPKTISSSEDEENLLRNEEITSTQPETMDIFEDIILNENEIIIGDESLEEEINLDLKSDELVVDQKPVLCTKASKKLYEDEQSQAPPKTHSSLREFRKVKTKPEPASPTQKVNVEVKDKKPLKSARAASRPKGGSQVAFQELIKQRKMRKEKIRLKYSQYVFGDDADKTQGVDEGSLEKEVRSEVRKVPKMVKVDKNQVCSAVHKVKGGDGAKKKDSEVKTKDKEKVRRRSVDENKQRINIIASVILKEPSSGANSDKKKTDEKPTSTSQLAVQPAPPTAQNFQEVRAPNEPEVARPPNALEKHPRFPKVSAPRDLSLTKHANEHYLSRKDHSNLKKKLSIQEYNSRKRKTEESKVPERAAKVARVEESKVCDDQRNRPKPSTIYSGKQFEKMANCVKDPRRLQFMNSERTGLLRCNSEEATTCRTLNISPFRSLSTGNTSDQSEPLLNRISIDNQLKNYKTAIPNQLILEINEPNTTNRRKTVDNKYESTGTVRRRVSFDDNVQINEVHTTQTKTVKIRQDSNSSCCEVTSSCSDNFEERTRDDCEDKNEGTNPKYQNSIVRRLQKSEVVRNDWEDSNSPKDCITDAFAHCFLEKNKLETLKGSKNKLIIDINDFDTSLIDNELKNSYQNSSKSNTSENGLKNYKEEVDLKLNSLNIQIPKTTKNRVPNEDDILMHKFLRKEQLSSEEIKQIRRIIYFKKKMQQLQINQQTTKPTEDNYEIKKTVENSPNKDLKLQLKKVDGKVKKKKKRFRNLYSESPETSENEVQETAGEFSVYGGENISGVKLIFKRKTDFLNLQPVVRLQRYAFIDSMAKKLRFE